MIGASRPWSVRTVLLLVALATLLSLPAGGWAQTVPESREQITLSFAPLVRDAAPAVVNIYTTRMVRQPAMPPLFSDPFFERFFGPGFPFGPGPQQQQQQREQQQNSLGSGVIVAPDGLVVTNHHVIDGADEIAVVLQDRREFRAEVLLSDERTDLAVLRVRPQNDALPYLELGDSDGLEVGDLVLAIGNPFGVGQTVTSGIVSALARTAGGITDYAFFIQTDAAINPGNSGGALIDMNGRVVGINTAIFSRSGGSMGIGFAVPSNMVRAVLASVETTGRLIRPWLGITGQVVTADLADSLGLDRPGGVLVAQIRPGSPAARAGIETGDVLLAVNGREIENFDGLFYRLATLPVGSETTLSVIRRGAALELPVTVELPPEDPPRQTATLQGRNPFAGAVVANLSPALVEEIGYSGSVDRGVVVLHVQANSPAARTGLRPHDVLVRIDGRAVTDVDGLHDLLRRGGNRPWDVVIRRGDQTLEATLRG